MTTEITTMWSDVIRVLMVEKEQFSKSRTKFSCFETNKNDNDLSNIDFPIEILLYF